MIFDETAPGGPNSGRNPPNTEFMLDSTVLRMVRERAVFMARQMAQAQTDEIHAAVDHYINGLTDEKFDAEIRQMVQREAKSAFQKEIRQMVERRAQDLFYGRSGQPPTSRAREDLRARLDDMVLESFRAIVRDVETETLREHRQSIENQQSASRGLPTDPA